MDINICTQNKHFNITIQNLNKYYAVFFDQNIDWKRALKKY